MVIRVFYGVFDRCYVQPSGDEMKTLSVKEFLALWALVIVVSFVLEAHAQVVVIDQSTGRVVGTLNGNKYDPDSIANQYSNIRNPYSPDSLANPYSSTVNPYMPGSINNPYSVPVPAYRYNYRNY